MLLSADQCELVLPVLTVQHDEPLAIPVKPDLVVDGQDDEMMPVGAARELLPRVPVPPGIYDNYVRPEIDGSSNTARANRPTVNSRWMRAKVLRNHRSGFPRMGFFGDQGNTCGQHQYAADCDEPT